jgi:uncharacterized protein YfaA (DUF2138 family)
MRVWGLRLFTIPALLCALTSLACSDSTSASALGNVSAQVIDANNAGIQGVQADLYKVVPGGAVLWRSGLTSSNGVAAFGATDGGVVSGDYYVHLSFVNNYRLVTGETNDKPVTVSSGSDNVVTFHVEAAKPGGPGA